jgi:hypothetical protein
LDALVFNNIGESNTAVGANALFNNTEGIQNTATGSNALFTNTIGNLNTAVGEAALALSTTGVGNTAVGFQALLSSTGNGNTALGAGAGGSVTTANNVICLGAAGANVNDSCFIGNIFGATSTGGSGVFINASGQLGTLTSSKRFKEEIKAMDKASEALLALKPVTFRYKKEIDPARTSQFGLVAEEVEKVNRDLVVRDKDGKPYSVRYDAVNAMLLNEFLKEHSKMEEQEATIVQQQKEIDALRGELKEQRALIQKVSDKLELDKPAPQTVLNNR